MEGRRCVGYLISVINNKGGVGKTLTTCNLAEGLGKAKKKALAVDIDSQCNATSILLPDHVDPYAVRSLYELLEPLDEEEEKDLDPEQLIYPTLCKNVTVIPNISDTANLEPELISSAPESFYRLRNRLRDFATQNYDLTILDCPPNMGTFVLCALYASDFVIVPVKAGSRFSMQGLIRATKLVAEVNKEANPDLKFLRLLINSVDKRTAVCKSVVDQLYRAFSSDQIFKTQIPINTAFEQAEALHETISRVKANASGARAFRELADEIIALLDL